MNKTIISAAVVALSALPALGQSALDAYSLSQSGLRGTARFMSMGGAFTALGGDLSTLNQNPGGIGVYRSSEIGATLDINAQSVKASDMNQSMSRNQTKVACNNFGYIGAVYTGSDVMPYFNWGASYSRVGSFDRAYKGRIGAMNGSLSNYIAGYMTADQWNSDDLTGFESTYNPYMDSEIPWLGILAYNGYLINPVGNSQTAYNGLWQNGTSGSAAFDVVEKGHVDEYSINFGGNVMNTLFWGVGFGITDIDYQSSTYYEEDLQNARIAQSENGGIVTGAGGFGLDSWKHMSGTGFNFKAGVIVKPINELRIGLAIHTPTYYNLRQEGWAQIDYGYGSGISGDTQTNDGYTDYFEWKLRTPWRLTAGVAGVIGSKGIISVDYEYRPTQNINVRDKYSVGYEDVNNDISTYYKAVNIIRIGGEYRLDRNWSLRAGYSVQSSPSQTTFSNSTEPVYTSGPDDTETTPSYSVDKTTQYITCGLGYRYKNFYADAAYIHEHRSGSFHAYTSSTYTATPPAVDLTDNNNRIALSVGFKF